MKKSGKLLKSKKNNKKVDVPTATRSSGFNFIVIIVVIGLLGAFITYAKAQITKYPSQPSPTINDNNFPVDKLELRDIQWGVNVFQAEILNKGDKPVYDIQMIFKTSKTRQVWDVDENYNYTVPYKIDPGQTIGIKVTGYTTKKDPWSTAWILSAKYYNGENIPTPTPSSTPKPYVNPDPIIACTMSKECGGGIRNVKRSECTNGTCCQIGSTWIFYPSNSSCTLAQNNYNSAAYPPCTIYYPSLGYSRTYNLLPSDCQYYKGQDNTTTQITNYPTFAPVPTFAPLPTYAPIPTLNTQPTATKQQCLSEASSAYTTETNDCRSQARANGILDSSWYQQCVQNVANQYNYLITLCDQLQ